MRRQAKSTRISALFMVAAAGALSATGCQVDLNGQTLPSPYFYKDDVQYFAPGPEYKLSKEAAAQREFNESQAQQAREGANR